MTLGEVGYDGQRLADQLDRLIRIAPRYGNHAEQMEGIRIARRLLQKPPVKCRGALEPSSPMMFDGDGQVSGRGRPAPPTGAITAARAMLHRSRRDT